MYLLYNRITFSITAVLFLLTSMMRPLDKGKGYHIFLHVHFILAFIVTDLFVSLRHARKGKWMMFGEEMAIILLFYIPAFWALLKFRKRLAALPPGELSKYLVEYVVKAGLAAILPMLFLR